MTRRPNNNFGKLIHTHQEDGEDVSIYLEGNQIYFVKDNKVLPNRTIHIDDLEDVIEALKELQNSLEEGDD